MNAAVTISPGEAAVGGGGTIVQLPPPLASPPIVAPVSSVSNVPTNDVAKTAPVVAATQPSGVETPRDDRLEVNIVKRRLNMEERKRELLLEARAACIDWILGGNSGSGPKSSNVQRDLLDEDDATATENLLRNLQACRPEVLPCAPQVINTMFSSNCDWRRQGVTSISHNGMLEQLLKRSGLSWDSVSTIPRSSGGGTEEKCEGASSSEVISAENLSSLDRPPIPSPQHYTAFLNTLCDPLAANLVISIKKFCKTFHEAANVMLSNIKENDQDGEDTGITTWDSKEPEIKLVGSNAFATGKIGHDHGVSLAKALRGFINKTMREMEEHEAFHNYLHVQKQVNEQANHDGSVTFNIDKSSREQLQASLEKFVHEKCNSDIHMVLLAGKETSRNGNRGILSNTTVNCLEEELHEKMLLMQFVSPAHLEIQCLKSCAQGDIDLSYPICQLRSINHQDSPRQILQSILLAHRGVMVALNGACGHDNPPGADDVLPTLILATLRAHPPNLSTTLRFIELFTPLPLLRGEVGYAYTNLCGAMQFIKELDVQGHLAEVTLGGMGEGAVLSIGPEEFRVGLEECRRKIIAEEEKLSMHNEQMVDSSEECGVVDTSGIETTGKSFPLKVKITARQVREARSNGETADLHWAIQKQSEPVSNEGGAMDIGQSPSKEAPTNDIAPVWQHGILPEEPPLPYQFSRSYSFLTAQPENFTTSELPQLLKEYKLLVHATEKLLNERLVWRENERKRQLKLERDRLERNFVDMIGMDKNSEVAASRTK